jgi:uncharacterized protein (DUF433 family)
LPHRPRLWSEESRRVAEVAMLNWGAMEIFPGISMDPAVRFGKPCLTGTRLDVATVVGAIASGESIEDVQQEYRLTREQVLAALAYAAHLAAHMPPAVAKAS